MVREFAREDERRVMLVLDPFLGPPRADLGQLAAAEHAERFERAVSLAACIAWHFHEIHSVMQFRTDRFSTPMAPAGEIIYDTLRELALIQADTSAAGGAFLDELASEQRNLQDHPHRAPAAHDPDRPLVLLVFPFRRSAVAERPFPRFVRQYRRDARTSSLPAR